MISISGHNIPHELHEVAHPSHTALVVIDMQNAYAYRRVGPERNLELIPNYAKAIETTRVMCKYSRQVGVPIIYVRNRTQESTYSPFWMRMRWRGQGQPIEGPQSMTPGSWEAEAVEGLEPEPGEDVVTKCRSSAFFGTPLETLLRVGEIRTILVAGYTTEGCVDSTVRDAGFRDFFPVVLTDRVTSNSPELHEAALLILGAYRADLATSEQVLEGWKHRSG